ncbi:MAG: hypothetical protein ACPGYV_05985 [Phycisphaeraceae bacterium]
MQGIDLRWILAGLAVFLVACGGEADRPATNQAPTSATADRSWQTSDADGYADTDATLGIDATGESDTPASPSDSDDTSVVDPLAGFRTDVPNAPHPIAGRSAFPEEGEDFGGPIAAETLSDDDPFAEPPDPSNIPDLVPWQQADRYVGQTITVVGRIVDTGQSRDGKVNFLNFHRDWRGKFYMVLFDDLAATLPDTVDERFRNKTVHVTGEVEEHRGRPQIKILSMDQVKFVP